MFTKSIVISISDYCVAFGNINLVNNRNKDIDINHQCIHRSYKSNSVCYLHVCECESVCLFVCVCVSCYITQIT